MCHLDRVPWGEGEDKGTHRVTTGPNVEDNDGRNIPGCPRPSHSRKTWPLIDITLLSFQHTNLVVLLIPLWQTNLRTYPLLQRPHRLITLSRFTCSHFNDPSKRTPSTIKTSSTYASNLIKVSYTSSRYQVSYTSSKTSFTLTRSSYQSLNLNEDSGTKISNFWY